MTQRQLVIHIGSPKTGTTAVQGVCHRSREALAGQGLYYFPQREAGPAHHGVGFALEAALGLAQAYEGVSLVERVAADRRDFDASGCQVGLLSTESLFELSRRSDAVAATLAAAFAGYEIRVICYLRPQEQFFASSFAQQVRRAPFTATGIGQCLDTDLAHSGSDFRRPLQQWFALLGAGRVTLRSYTRDLLADFCNALPLALDGDRLDPPRQQNASPPAQLVHLFNRLNRVALGSSERQQLYRALEDAASGVSLPPAGLLSATQQRAIAAHYHSANRALAAQAAANPASCVALEAAVREDLPQVGDAHLPALLEALPPALAAQARALLAAGN